MKSNEILFLQLKERVLGDAFLPLKESLDKADESTVNKLALVDFKSPALGLIFSVILPGADRIYKGDLLLGIFKLIYFVAVYIGIEAGLGDNISSNDTALMLLWLLTVLSLLVWLIADIFLVWRGIKRENLKKIFVILEEKNG